MSEIEDLAYAITKAVRVPPECRYVGMDVIAEMLDLSVSHVKQRIVSRQDFPKPMRLAPEVEDGKAGHPRWKMTDVVAWADEHRER